MRARMLLPTGLMALALACGGQPLVEVDGSSTVFPITEAIAEEFQLEGHGVLITVGQSGTGGGFEKFCNGEVDLANASRPIKPEEAANCRRQGIEPVELEVALDGLSVVVHPRNDFVDCLSIEQLQAMWRPDSPITTWSDLDPSWPDETIKFFSPGADSGTFDYFTDAVVGEEGAMRQGPEVQTSEDDNILVQGIANNRYAIGYFGFAYYAENEERLKAVAVDGGEGGCVEPSEDTIESGRYAPLSRPLFIYASDRKLRRQAVRSFVDFYLENVNDYVGDIGYIPVPEDALEQARTTLVRATEGP